MSLNSNEIQKDLEKATLYENEGNFEKAAKTYFKLANLLSENEQSIRLFNKAFFTARKSGHTNLMYKFGKAYFDVLTHWNQQKRIEELIPTFLEISGRKKDQIVENKSSEDIDELFDWITDLYQLTGNVNAAYDVSQQAGEVISSVGYDLLSGSYIIGKDEKWNRGLELLDNAIEAYQQIRLDKHALENIIEVKLNKIGYLIDIGRNNEGIEEKSCLIDFYSSQKEEIKPFSNKDLFLKIATLFSEKSFLLAQSKKFEIADALLKVAKTEFENGEKFSEIVPFLWKIALIYEENNQKEAFFNLLDETFSTAEKYKEKKTQEEILNHLESLGKEICNNIIHSRRLMIQKGPIEFQYSEGVHYLLKGIEYAKEKNNTEQISNILNFLYQYAQEMYAKKLVNRSLPYFEFTAQSWFDLANNLNQTHTIVKFLDTRLNELLTNAKFDDAAAHLGVVISIKSFIGEAESAGDSAFSFAKSAAHQGKHNIEIEFLERAYDAFKKISTESKLKEMLDYVIQQLDRILISKTKKDDYRDRLLEIGNYIASTISLETQGEFLQATTFKALNSDLIELGINTAKKTFEILKLYNKQLAADFYFNLGTKIINIDNEKGIDFINKSLEFASHSEHLENVIERNLSFLKEEALKSEDLSQKVFYANNLDVMTKNISRRNSFLEFLIPFTKDLAKNAQDKAFFNEMKKFLSLSFNEYYKIDKNHAKLNEIIEWTRTYTIDNYSTENFIQSYDLALINFTFYEKMGDIENYLEFLWEIIEKFSSDEYFTHIIDLFNQTNQFLNRSEQPNTIKQELTGKVVSLLEHSLKSKIKDEKFEEAWKLLQDLFNILKDNNLESQAITLYKTNAVYFANERLDISLSMWTIAIETAKMIIDTESLLAISDTITKEIIPIYVDKGMLEAVDQLYEQAINAKQALGDDQNLLDLYIEAGRISLSLGEIENLHKWGEEGFRLATEYKLEKALNEFANMYFAVGRGFLSENPETSIKMINEASNYLRGYGPSGYDYFCLKMSEIYEDIYNTPQTTEFAQNEREKILQHFKSTNNLKEEGKFLLITAKLSFQAKNITEGVDLISKATEIFQELEDSDGLSEIVSVCLKTAAQYTVGSNEYEMLSRHATMIQESGTVEIDEDKTQEAFKDLFDGLLNDMTELMDPKKRKERKKKK